MIRKHIRLFLMIFFFLFIQEYLNAQDQVIGESWSFLLKPDTVAGNESASHFYLYSSGEVISELALRLQGLRVVRRLDWKHAIVQPLSGLADGVELTGLKPVNAHWKLSPNLKELRPGYQRSAYIVRFLRGIRADSILSSSDWDYVVLRSNVIRLSATESEILEVILPNPSVSYVGKEATQVIEESRVLDLNLNPNSINRVHRNYPELNGSGQVLSLKESAYDENDIDLVGRHLNSRLEGESVSAHATDMATIAGGAGNSSLNGKGVASGVTLTSSFLNDLFPDQGSDFLELNVGVQNHSYGTTEIENFYGAAAEAYDLSANNNPALLHVFSAGNLGMSDPQSGRYAGASQVANLTGNFKLSKNSLLVTSVDTVGRAIDFVSRGPTHDGRIKPELTTYSMAGSSNSAALVSGMAILLKQAFEEEYNRQPPSALLKALLINGARDVGETGPDYITGFGNLDALRSMQALKESRFYSGSVAQGDEAVVELTIPDGAINLKLTLVWNDPAAQANANIALVNDLDLSVLDGENNEWLPWVLNPSPDRLSDPAVRGIDRLNNVEQVTVPSLQPGNHTVKVKAFNVSGGEQDFHLVWQWEMAETFDWDFPTGSDNMPYNGETVSYFRWYSTLAAENGRLEYSIDGGNNWQVISESVLLNQGYFRWDAPELKTVAQARMVIDGQSYLTESFTISRPDRIGVGFSCADSVRIQWRQNPEVSSYRILSLGQTRLEPVAEVTDTAFTFRKSDFATRFFAVQPVLPGGELPVRSATFDYDFQGVSCYLFSFSTEILADEGIYAHLKLGTTAGVAGVSLERRTDGGRFEAVETLEGIVVKDSISILDESPFQGLNEYRARLYFENGEELTSDVSSAYFLTTRPFLVFPNPLPRGERLNVFSKIFPEGQLVNFSLFDLSGNRMFELEVESDRFVMSLTSVPSGLYYYRITTNALVYKGRVVLE